MITNGSIQLTEKILGVNDVDLVHVLKQIALANDLKHIAHLRFVPKKSNELSLLTSTVTYPIEWQHRYFGLVAVWSGSRAANRCRMAGLAPTRMFLGSAEKGRFFVPA